MIRLAHYAAAALNCAKNGKLTLNARSYSQTQRQVIRSKRYAVKIGWVNCSKFQNGGAGIPRRAGHNPFTRVMPPPGTAGKPAPDPTNPTTTTGRINEGKTAGYQGAA
jgi:hypothetical protein